VDGQPVAFVFPGQGSHAAGMHRGLLGAEAARLALEEASDALGADIGALCDDAARLAETAWAQPAILACSVAAARALEALDLAPALVAGHSMGEISALVCAGSLALPDAVRLVHARGACMAEAPPGGMAVSFGLDRDRVAEICAASCAPGAFVGIANDNASSQVVLSGHTAALDRATSALTAAGAVLHRLPIAIAAHSPCMASAADAFGERVRALDLAPPRLPVLSPTTGGRLADVAAIRAMLVDQLTRPVGWRRTMEAVAAEVAVVIEVGPRTVLRDLFRLEHPVVVACAAGDEDGITTALRASRHVAPAPIPSWRGFVPGCLAAVAATRVHGPVAANYRQRVGECWSRLVALRARQEEGPLDGARLREAGELLRQILRAKRLPEAERTARFADLFAVTGTRPLFPDFEP